MSETPPPDSAAPGSLADRDLKEVELLRSGIRRVGADGRSAMLAVEPLEHGVGLFELHGAGLRLLIFLTPIEAAHIGGLLLGKAVACIVDREAERNASIKKAEALQASWDRIPWASLHAFSHAHGGLPGDDVIRVVLEFAEKASARIAELESALRSLSEKERP